MQRILESWGNLVHVWRDVADFIDLAWSDLSDVHIDHETVVAIDLHELFLVQVFGVKVVLNINMLVGKNDIRVSKLVAWRLNVGHSNVLVDFVGIEAEVKVGVGGDLVESISLECKLVVLAHLLFESSEFKLLLNELVDFSLDLFHFLMVTILWLSQLKKVRLTSRSVTQHGIVVLVLVLDLLVPLLYPLREFLHRLSILSPLVVTPLDILVVLVSGGS